jgi:hypothetical protein
MGPANVHMSPANMHTGAASAEVTAGEVTPAEVTSAEVTPAKVTPASVSATSVSAASMTASTTSKGGCRDCRATQKHGGDGYEQCFSQHQDLHQIVVSSTKLYRRIFSVIDAIPQDNARRQGVATRTTDKLSASASSATNFSVRLRCSQISRNHRECRAGALVVRRSSRKPHDARRRCSYQHFDLMISRYCSIERETCGTLACMVRAPKACVIMTEAFSPNAMLQRKRAASAFFRRAVSPS